MRDVIVEKCPSFEANVKAAITFLYNRQKLAFKSINEDAKAGAGTVSQKSALQFELCSSRRNLSMSPMAHSTPSGLPRCATHSAGMPPRYIGAQKVLLIR